MHVDVKLSPLLCCATTLLVCCVFTQLVRQAGGLCRASKVVAVVGAGHLQGLQDKWEAEIDIQELTRMPEKRASRRWRNVLLLATAGGVVAASVTVVVQWRRRR